MNGWDIHSFILTAYSGCLFSVFVRRDSFSTIVKVEWILRFLIFKHLFPESRGTWNSCCANRAHLAQSSPLVSLKGAFCSWSSPCIGDRQNNWAGFYFPATQTGILIVIYSYSTFKWGKRYKNCSALGGRDGQCGNGERMLRPLSSTCAVALSPSDSAWEL